MPNRSMLQVPWFNQVKINSQTNFKLKKSDIALDLNFRSLITSKKTFMVRVLFWENFQEPFDV